MVEITYQLKGQDLKKLGNVERTPEGKLRIILDASTITEIIEKKDAVVLFPMADIYLDGKKTNYWDILKTLGFS